jgi:hypothetical protein
MWVILWMSTLVHSDEPGPRGDHLEECSPARYGYMFSTGGLIYKGIRAYPTQLEAWATAWEMNVAEGNVCRYFVVSSDEYDMYWAKVVRPFSVEA